MKDETLCANCSHMGVCKYSGNYKELSERLFRIMQNYGNVSSGFTVKIDCPNYKDKSCKHGMFGIR